MWTKDPDPVPQHCFIHEKHFTFFKYYKFLPFLLRHQGDLIHSEESHPLVVEDPEPVEDQAGDQGLPLARGEDDHHVPLHSLQVALDLGG